MITETGQTREKLRPRSIKHMVYIYKKNDAFKQILPPGRQTKVSECEDLDSRSLNTTDKGV